MQNAAETRTALPLRSHTILGVCEAIGEDFGFNPTWIRVPLAASVLVSLKYAVAAYLLLGIIVLGSRLLFPQPTVARDSVDAGDAKVQTHNDAETAELPLAA